jgi:hypothetical protein
VRTAEGFDSVTDPAKPGITADSLAALRVQAWSRFQFFRHGGAP